MGVGLGWGFGAAFGAEYIDTRAEFETAPKKTGGGILRDAAMALGPRKVVNSKFGA